MESNEIMATKNEVIEEVTNDIANAESGIAGKVIAGVAVTIAVGGLIYKFVAKPLIAKHKAKKEEQAKAKVIEYDEFDPELDCVEDAE